MQLLADVVEVLWAPCIQLPRAERLESEVDLLFVRTAGHDHTEPGWQTLKLIADERGQFVSAVPGCLVEGVNQQHMRLVCDRNRISQWNPHLHILVSAGGFQESEGRWISRLHLDKPELMQMWRLALIAYLWLVLRARALRSDLCTEQLKKVLQEQYKRDWIIYISPFMSKARFLRYAGRYIRRPPIPLHHIAKITDREVRFLAKDTRAKRMVELLWPKEMFVDNLGEHVLDCYRHAMRYFGLLAPGSKARTSAALFLLLGQQKRPRPRRLSWAFSLRRDFGVNPLIDSHGQSMHWVRRQGPVAGRNPAHDD